MQNDEMISLSQMTAKEGREKELEKALRALIKPTLQEKGCLAYELWRDFKDERSFIMYERFQDQKALEAHVKMPYIQDFIKNEYTTYVESHWDGDFKPISL